MRRIAPSITILFLFAGCGDPYGASTSAVDSSSAQSRQEAEAETLSTSPPPEGSNARAGQLGDKEHAHQVSLDRVLQLWQEGDQEPAAAAFQSITDWDTLEASADSVFAISEQSFMAASRARQTELTETLIQSNQTLRQLARYIIAEAKNETDVAKARDMLKKIEACGTWLQAPSRTKQVQALGRGLGMTAAKELEQLPPE